MRLKRIALAAWIILGVLATAFVVWLALSAYVMWVTRD
jgi:hypothetical protein